MEVKEREYFKNLLLQIREENLKQWQDVEKDLSSNVKEASGEHSSYSFHLADMGTDSIEREKTFILASMETELLKEIDYALSKINNGNYGICEQCDLAIDHKRLEAIPHTRLCLECKSKNENLKA